MTPPDIGALLPAARDASGVGVQVVNAGFGSLRELISVSNRTVPLFFVDYRVTPPDPKLTGGIVHPWAVLKRLRGPRGETIYPDHDSTAGGALRVVFPRVNPAWKNVTAIWETVVPGAPADISGEFKTRYSVTGALPTRENPIAMSQAQVVTEHGTTVRLVSIEADFGADKTTYAFELSRPTTAVTATTAIDPQTLNVIDDKGRVFTRQRCGFDSRQQPIIKLIYAGVPTADATTATVSFDVIEQSARWRKSDAYGTLEIEVPVAALFAAKTFAPDDGKLDPTRTMATETWRAENAGFRARIERLGRKDGFRATIWVAPKTTAKPDAPATATQTVAEAVAMRVSNAAGQAVEVNLEPESTYYYFHDDSTPIAAGETRADVPDMNAQTTIALDVQSRQRAEHFLDVRDISIERGQTQTLARPTANGDLWLKNVVWTDAETAPKIAFASGGRLSVPAGALVLVVAHTPFAPDTTLEFDYVNISDDAGTPARRVSDRWNGDALSGASGNAWTLVLTPPAPDATRADVRVRATENGPVQSNSTLEFPNVNWSNNAPPTP